MPHNQFSLLKVRRFAPLFVTQFLGAFHDNLFKNALVVMLLFGTAQRAEADAAILTTLAAGLFILPFVVAVVGLWAEFRSRRESRAR